MATVLRSKIVGKADPMAPDVVMGHIVETSRRLARQDGSPCAVHAVQCWRIAYTQLWARLEALQETAIPFMAGDECGEGVLS